MMPQSQVLFLQPVVSNSSTSPQAGSEPIRQSKGYKTYPKIAPHPADASPKTLGSSHSGSASVYSQRRRRYRRSHTLDSCPVPQPLRAPFKAVSSSEEASVQSDLAASQEVSLPLLAGTDSVPFDANQLRTATDFDGTLALHHRSSSHSDKRKRFGNTYDILNRSGLLSITMRTKQLIKENKRTQGYLQQLQVQTNLLLEAMSTGDPYLWSQLQLSMQHTNKERRDAAAHRVMG